LADDYQKCCLGQQFLFLAFSYYIIITYFVFDISYFVGFCALFCFNFLMKSLINNTKTIKVAKNHDNEAQKKKMNEKRAKQNV
jgi:hypothetical protein